MQQNFRVCFCWNKYWTTTLNNFCQVYTWGFWQQYISFSHNENTVWWVTPSFQVSQYVSTFFVFLTYLPPHSHSHSHPHHPKVRNVIEAERFIVPRISLRPDSSSSSNSPVAPHSTEDGGPFLFEVLGAPGSKVKTNQVQLNPSRQVVIGIIHVLWLRVFVHLIICRKSCQP